MKTELLNKIRESLKECDELQKENEADPYQASVIEAQGQITAAEVLLKESLTEPEDLTPMQIVERRNQMAASAENSKQAAEISLRRATTQRSQYFSLLWQKASETREDAHQLIKQIKDWFENQIEAAVKAIGRDYFSEYSVGLTVPKAIAKHRSAALRRVEKLLDSSTIRPDKLSEDIAQTRKALELALEHLEEKV